MIKLSQMAFSLDQTKLNQTRCIYFGIYQTNHEAPYDQMGPLGCQNGWRMAERGLLQGNLVLRKRAAKYEGGTYPM